MHMSMSLMMDLPCGHAEIHCLLLWIAYIYYPTNGIKGKQDQISFLWSLALFSLYSNVWALQIHQSCNSSHHYRNIADNVIGACWQFS